MTYGMYLSAAGAEVQSRRIEILSNNLANVDTTGFKREMAAVEARAAEAIEQGWVDPGTGRPEDIGGGVRLRETMTNFSLGAIKKTGNGTDLAIPHETLDFFSVSRQGKEMLTRAGNFNFDRIGMLVTAQGYPVLGTNNEPIVAVPGGPTPEIHTSGSIRQGGNLLGVLKVSRVAEPGDLVHAGENMFTSLSEAQPVPVNQRALAVGYLEQSGVKPTVELMELTEASRAYQANVSMIQHHDSVLSSLVNRVMRS